VNAELDPIRRATKRQLRDRRWLEEVISALGVGDIRQPMPPFYDGTGLRLLQYPNQLAPYLISVGKLGVRTYAEIGLWTGGTFALTVEYLTRFGLERALGIDMELQDPVIAYAKAKPNVKLIEGLSHEPKVRRALRAMKPDLVLIDADHSEEACRADWELVRGVARHVAFHDIVGEGTPGVHEVWRSIEGLKKKEWTEQFPGGEVEQGGMGLVTNLERTTA
jgi:cephalosporin hydroxylase